MEQTISLAAEQLEVEVRTVETGTVTVATQVIETEEVVSLPLQRDDVEIERISMNQVVEYALPTRQEGDVTIIPVYEEVLVVTRQLVLKEELHVRLRRSVQAAPPQVFKLRREEVTINRIPSHSPEDPARLSD